MTLVTRYVETLKTRAFPARGPEPKVAYLSTYPPRECGIATFCEDVLQATREDLSAAAPIVIAMEGGARYHQYARPVVHVVDDRSVDEYQTAAEFINDSPAEVVNLQHEFGVYGGLEGRGLYRFMRTLRKPLLTTLHTVLPDPEPGVREMICALAEHSGRVVVMNPIASQILHHDYGVPMNKLTFIHHGAPAPSGEAREAVKQRLGVGGKKVMCTFGLVGAGKGLEHALRALPPVVRKHPDLVYLIVGQTHPGALRDGVDEYREKLVRLTQELGIEEHVRFVNRYLTKAEIISYLAASDLYITPYLNPGQICSGTLAYAVAAGKAIISTPYLHARFLLGSNRGVLAEFANADSISEAIARVFDTPGLQMQLEARTRAYAPRLLWPEVGARYRSLLREVSGPRLLPAPVRPSIVSVRAAQPAVESAA